MVNFSMSEMPLHVQKMVEKINEEMREFYAVKRQEFADQLGLPASDPIRLTPFRGTFASDVVMPGGGGQASRRCAQSAKADFGPPPASREIGKA